MYITLPPQNPILYRLKNEKNHTFKPRHSRPSETALRLRSFPRGGPPLAEFFFSKKSKSMIFFTKFIVFIVFTVYFWSNFIFQSITLTWTHTSVQSYSPTHEQILRYWLKNNKIFFYCDVDLFFCIHNVFIEFTKNQSPNKSAGRVDQISNF